MELECPFQIFIYIIELFETGECDLQLIEKFSYKKELIEWCNLYCLNHFIPYLSGYSNQLNDIPPEYLEIYQQIVVLDRQVMEICEHWSRWFSFLVCM